MSPSRDVTSLHSALDALEAHVAGVEADWRARAASVSGWSVAQQVEHTLRAFSAMLGVVVSLAPSGSAPPQARAARARPTFAGRFVLFTGRIPRGRGRAPATLLPVEEPTQAAARELLAAARAELRRLSEAREDVGRWPGALPHPALGLFSAAHWLRFARIHTLHHLRLVADILRAAGRQRNLSTGG
jgi:hypothetical protein